MFKFYVLEPRDAVAPPHLTPGVVVRMWRPSPVARPPISLRNATHWTWWLFHVLHIFANRDFGVVIIEREGQLVHHSGVFPRYFRFPFMSADDLQIGDTWTAPDARRQGLATLAIEWTLSHLGKPGRRFWYVVEEANEPSVRVIEKLGFTLAGTGSRFPRARVHALGYFAITNSAEKQG